MHGGSEGSQNSPKLVKDGSQMVGIPSLELLEMIQIGNFDIDFFSLLLLYPATIYKIGIFCSTFLA